MQTTKGAQCNGTCPHSAGRCLPKQGTIAKHPRQLSISAAMLALHGAAAVEELQLSCFALASTANIALSGVSSPDDGIMYTVEEQQERIAEGSEKPRRQLPDSSTPTATSGIVGVYVCGPCGMV